MKYGEGIGGIVGRRLLNKLSKFPPGNGPEEEPREGANVVEPGNGLREVPKKEPREGANVVVPKGGQGDLDEDDAGSVVAEKSISGGRSIASG